MTRQEYLKLLKYKLEALDSATREDILQELDSHIDDLRAAHPGESEEETILRLDSPGLVAQAILDEGLTIEKKRNAGSDASGSTGSASGEEGEGDRSDPCCEGNRHHRYRIRTTFNLGDFLESRMRGEKYRDRSGPDSFSKEIPAREADSIVVRAISADVEVLSSVSEIRVGAEGLVDSDHFTAVLEGRTLVLEEKKRLQGLDLILVRVPAQIEVLRLQSTSGDISVNGVDASLSCSTKSGDIEVQDCTDAGIKTISGDVEVANLAGKVEITTTSGDVALENQASDARVTTVSGDIGIKECAGSLRVESTSGNIGIEAKRLFGGAVVNTISGDVECRLGREIGARVRAVTVSGEIRIEVDGEQLRTRQAVVGDGSVPLSLSSVSGDLCARFDGK